MAEQNNAALFLQVDASIELLRRNLAAGEQPLSRFEQRVQKAARTVDQSIADMGDRFGPFAQLAQSAANKVQQSFESSFNDIQKAAAKAVSTPIGGDGRVSIGADEARAAAAAAQQRAVALGLIEQAAIRASAGEGILTAETRAYLAAAQAARIEGEQHAATLLREAGALDRLEIELQQAGAATKLLGTQQQVVRTGSGQLRAASQQLSYQISDVATSFAGGINPMVIFAQQGSQVIQAISLMQTTSGGLIGFLAGPWGAAILGAVSIIGVLASKHGEAAEASKLHKGASDALSDALRRLTSAAAAEQHQTEQGILTDIAAAEAKRAREVATRKALLAELELARAKSQEANRIANGPSVGGEGGINIDAVVAGRAAKEVAELSTQIDRVNKSIDNASQAIAIGRGAIIRRAASGRGDPATAETIRNENTLDALQRKFESGGFGNRRTVEAERAYADALDRETTRHKAAEKLIQESNKKDKKGPSADTLARRAESQRQAAISDDLSFNDQERQARRRLLEATRKSATSEEQRDTLIREEINAEADAEARKIKLQQSRGDRSAAEAARLLALNEGVRKQKLENVALDRARDVLLRQFDARQNGLDVEIATLRLQVDFADTQKERKELALKLLAAEQEAARVELQRIRDTSDDPRAVANAQARLAALPAIERAQQNEVARRNETRPEAYQRQLIRNSKQVGEAIDDIKVDALDRLNDGLVDAITGVHSLGDVFRNISKQIIADLLRIAVQKAIIGPLADTLFAGVGGGGIGRLFGGGRAVGGAVDPSSFYLVGEKGPELFAPGVSGSIIPNGALRSPSLPSSNAGAAGGITTIRLALSGDIDARIDSRAAGIAVQVVRAAAPEIANAASDQTISMLSRARI